MIGTFFKKEAHIAIANDNKNLKSLSWWYWAMGAYFCACRLTKYTYLVYNNKITYLGVAIEEYNELRRN